MLILDALMDDIIIMIIITSAHTSHEHILGGNICAKKVISAVLICDTQNVFETAYAYE
jgi:hypothetical protein